MRIRTYRRRVTAALAISLVPLLLAPWHAAADPARTVRITVHSEAMDRDIPLGGDPSRRHERAAPDAVSAQRCRWRRGQRNVGRSDRCPGLLRRQERQRRDAAGRSVSATTPTGRRTIPYSDATSGRRSSRGNCRQSSMPQFGTNGVNSIAAISMTATSVLNLAISAPGLYRRCRGLQRVRGDFHPAWSGLRAPGGRCAGAALIRQTCGDRSTVRDGARTIPS